MDLVLKDVAKEIINKIKERRIVNPLDYSIDCGDYIIVGTEGYGDRHLINKSLRKSFKSRKDKVKFRQALFMELADNAHYKKQFISNNKSGRIGKEHINFVFKWLDYTADIDGSELSVANRNLLIDRKLSSMISHYLHVDELLSCVQVMIRNREDGIINIPYPKHRPTYYKWIEKF